MNLASREAALQSAIPLCRSPQYGTMAELLPGQTRYVMARDGLFLESRSNVCHACALTTPAMGSLHLPFGEVKSHVTLAGGELSTELLNEMIERARRKLPNEWGALVIWNGQAYEIIEPEPIEASPHRIRYSTAGINPSDVVLDCHSHGRSKAYFSDDDDADDRAMMSPAFFAAVLGDLHRREISVVRRLVANGKFFWPVDAAWIYSDLLDVGLSSIQPKSQRKRA